MKRKNATRSALFTSIISLLLCMSMLVGTTFAWFTDEVKSANNIIKSGNLDIVLEYWDGDSWEDVTGKADILSEDLWEPGYVDTAYLRLKNAGSLALKYQLGVNIVSEKEGVNQQGNPFKLSDYIYFDVIEGINGETGAYANRTAALADVTENTKISEGYSKAGDLVAKSEYVYLALIAHMPTTVGNDANHNGTDVPQIDLGINVFATQFTSEKDSYDELYDSGASWVGSADYSWYDPSATEYVINSAEQLAGLAALVNGTATSDIATYADTAPATIQDDFKGKTIKLISDIDLAGKNWTPIGSESNLFKGVFDGGNYTISNLTIKDLDGDCVALFGFIDKTTVKNIKIHNVNVHGLQRVAAAVGATKPGAIIDNVHVSGNIKLVADMYYAAGIVTHGYVTVQNCSVIADEMGTISSSGSMVGGICGWRGEGKSSIVNCHVKNMNLTGHASVGGLAALIHYNNTVSDCSVENVTLTKTRVDGWGSIGALCGNWGGVDKAGTAVYTVTNNTIKNVTLNGTAIKLFSEIYGSKYSSPEAVMPLVESNNTFENITSNLVEVTQIADGIVENNGVKQIFTADGLISLGGTKVSGIYELIADLDMTGKEMKPIQVANNESLIFRGNGHTISNVTIVAANANGMTGAGNEVAGLFDVSATASANLTVSDLTIKNANVACSGYAAVIVGYANSTTDVITLNNVDVIGATITSDSVAALVGYTVGPLTLTDCDVSGLTLTGEEGRPDKVGAFVGTANQAACTVTVTNCTNGTGYNFAGRVINGATMTHDGNSFVSDGLYTDAAGNYYVYNAAGLQALNEYFKDGAYGHAIWGATFNIMADIDASNTTWNSVKLNTPNNDCVGFTVNGNDHTISGLTINGSGMFSSTANGKNTEEPATFKNLTFDGAAVTGGYHTGIIWGQMYGDIVLDNVHVTNSTVTGTCNVGAFVGRNGDEGASTVAYKNCSVTNTKITATGNGDPNGASVFQGSALTINNGASVTITFENCSQTGNTLTSAEGQVGGGIYACWNASTNETSVVNDFT